MKKTTLLKNLILDKDILMMPGAFDALSAVIAEKAGFKAMCLGGYPATASILGKPDISFLTLTEMARHAGNIADAADIPLLADGDTEHGGLLNVRRTVKLLEKRAWPGCLSKTRFFPNAAGIWKENRSFRQRKW